MIAQGQGVIIKDNNVYSQAAVKDIQSCSERFRALTSREYVMEQWRKYRPKNRVYQD